MPADETRKERELAELAALADGSLPAGRRADLEQRVAASPRLQALLCEQREALEAVRALDDRAPHRLRESIATTRARPGRRPRAAAAAIALAVASGVATLVLIALPGSEPAAPTLAEAAALADRQPALRALPSGETAWGLAFPDLERRGGWKDAGARLDRVGGRDARTVYYVRSERRIAYTILSTGLVSVPAGTLTWWRKGKPWYAFNRRGHAVVAWERKGHMCVVSASGLSSRRLVDLITR
jgi:hypothetical protein